MKTNKLSLFEQLKRVSQQITETVYLEREVTLPGDIRVVLGTLSAREEADAYDYASSWGQGTFMLRLKFDQLASSIKEIHFGNMHLDFRVDSIVISTDPKSKTDDSRPKKEVLRDFLLEWDDTIIQALFIQLVDLTAELREKVTGQVKKDSEGDAPQEPLGEFKTEPPPDNLFINPHDEDDEEGEPTEE